MAGSQQLICTVYFRSRDGRLAGHVTQGSSVFEACRNSLVWFADPFWLGPQPEEDTILEIGVVSRRETWRVRAGRVMNEHPS